MVKGVAKKKARISKKSVPGKKVKKSDRWRSVKYVVVGGDISMSTISLAGLALTKDGKVRNGAISVRWSKDIDYFVRMREAARAHEIVADLFAELKVMPELKDVHFAVEEAVPIGMLQRGSRGKASGMAGAFLKQQIQISGAFIGGLLRYGWNNLYEIQANQWRKLVADDIAKSTGLDFTTHKSKWGNPELFPLKSDTKVKDVGKYRAQQWVYEFHPKWDKGWEDIVSTSHGQQLRGESKAQGLQCNDIYEAFAMAEFMRRELKN